MGFTKAGLLTKRAVTIEDAGFLFSVKPEASARYSIVKNSKIDLVENSHGIWLSEYHCRKFITYSKQLNSLLVKAGIEDEAYNAFKLGLYEVPIAENFEQGNLDHVAVETDHGHLLEYTDYQKFIQLTKALESLYSEKIG